MEKTEAVFALSAALFGSALAADRILASDSWLWASAPTHAYGLIGFMGLDAVLVAAAWRGMRGAGIVSVVLAVVQLLAMGGDLSGLSLPPGVQASAFQSYLLSDGAFVVLLSLQPAIAFLGGLVRMEERRQRV